MQKFLLALVSLVLLSPTALAQVWHLEDCPPGHAKERLEFREQLKELEPGDRGYRPNPFPTTTDEVVENFLTFHRRAYSDMAFENLRPTDQRLFNLVDSGHAKYTLRRVANWTPTRCRKREREDYFYVVQVIDSRTGVEVTRFAVDEEGDVAQLRHRYMDPASENDLTPMPDLRTASPTNLPRGISAPIKSRQYVNVWGSVRCGLLDPCVAFKAGGKTYFMKEGEVYKVEVNRRRMTVAGEMGSAAAKQAFFKRMNDRNEMFASIGAGKLAYISRVEP